MKIINLLFFQLTAHSQEGALLVSIKSENVNLDKGTEETAHPESVCVRALSTSY
jgi:hypothetical protein